MKLVCGRYHCLVLLGNLSFIWFIFLENGEVYSWGYNFWGQLGHGDNEDRKTPH